ncbi:MAG: hypothetical protein ABL930_09390 [Pseudobdellovibrio sp.]
MTSFVSVNASELSWKTLASDKISIEEYSSAQGEVISSYIPFFQEIGKTFWSWDPKKEPKNASGNVYLEPQLPLNELMHNLFIEFDVSNTNNFRKVWFKLSPHLQVRGLFGIHDFTKKRPFIILRMGIHGNVDELIAEKFLFKLLYEDLGANVLLLESLTSHAFLSKNKNISFGGIDEGLQTFLVLNEIGKNEFTKKLISTTHLIGLSMGSHGTFVTAMLDQANAHKINSIVNFCPLINLQQTFETHNLPESNFKNAMADVWNVRRLHKVFDLYPQNAELNNWWKTLFDFKPRFTNEILNTFALERKKPLISTAEVESAVIKMKWPEGLKNHLENSKSFYELNNFWKLYNNIKTPMTIYTTPNDPLVMNKLNSELIFRAQQPGDFMEMKYLRLEKGIHCGLAPVYQWDYIVNLVRQGLLL